MRIINVYGDCKSPDSSLTQEALSRHSAVIGSDAQMRLSQLTIGIVGAGGIGSELIDKLMRLAPKRMVVIDDDIIEY